MNTASTLNSERFRRIAPFVGNRIRQARLAMKLSQSQLADKAGVHRSTVSAVECGKRDNIGLNHIESLSHALGFTLNTLLALSDQDSQKGA